MNEKRQQLMITVTNQIQTKKKRIEKDKMLVRFDLCRFWLFILLYLYHYCLYYNAKIMSLNF